MAGLFAFLHFLANYDKIKNLFEKSVAKPFLVICRKIFHVFIVVHCVLVGSLSHGICYEISIAFVVYSVDRPLQEMVGDVHHTKNDNQLCIL